MLWTTSSNNLKKGFVKIPKQGQSGLKIVGIAILLYLILMLPQVSGPFIAQVIVIVSLYALMGLGLNITIPNPSMHTG